jgi:hypothetical protein
MALAVPPTPPIKKKDRVRGASRAQALAWRRVRTGRSGLQPRHINPPVILRNQPTRRSRAQIPFTLRKTCHPERSRKICVCFSRPSKARLVGRGFNPGKHPTHKEERSYTRRKPRSNVRRSKGTAGRSGLQPRHINQPINLRNQSTRRSRAQTGSIPTPPASHQARATRRNAAASRVPQVSLTGSAEIGTIEIESFSTPCFVSGYDFTSCGKTRYRREAGVSTPA